MALKLLLNFLKYYTKPNNGCAYLIIVGSGYLLKFCTFKLLIHKPLGVISKPRNMVVLHKKLQFLSLQ